MPSPFQGMDPYLENPGLWPDVHHNLISRIQGQLSAQLRPNYLVRVEDRAYIADQANETFDPQMRIPDVEVTSRPGWEDAPFSLGTEPSQLQIAEPIVATTWFDEEIREAFLKIISRESREVIAVIEILSPANKARGAAGRESFEKKSREIMYSPIHRVEIDLLRGETHGPCPQESESVRVPGTCLQGEPAAAGPALCDTPGATSAYYPDPLEARGSRRNARPPGCSRCRVRERQLRSGDRLQARANPPLSGKLAEWADQLLRPKGLR